MADESTFTSKRHKDVAAYPMAAFPLLPFADGRPPFAPFALGPFAPFEPFDGDRPLAPFAVGPLAPFADGGFACRYHRLATVGRRYRRLTVAGR
jgi:hypothetical protein